MRTDRSGDGVRLLAMGAAFIVLIGVVALAMALKAGG